jgi:hypothetical protein
MQSHQMKRAVAGASAPTDPDFKQVTLLLHGDGTNGGQNNTFIDGSTNNFTITRYGNVAQGTFSPYSQPDGRWSNYFDGTDDYLSIADNTALQPGTSTFTLEAWIYRGASGAAHTIYAKGGASTGFVFQVTSTNVLRFTDTTTNIDSTGTISANQWVHVAAVREGTGTNQLKLYINGVSDGTGTSSTNFNQTEQARIGTDRSAANDFNGYISNLRFVKGSTVYTGAFTPPTSPLTSITNTSLLTCQSNRFKDNSSNAFTLTKNGDVKVTPFAPFAPTDIYAASTNGGVGYFDSVDDYLTAPSNAAFDFGTGDFTIEMWIYPEVLSNIPMFFCRGTSTTWFFQTDTTTLYWGSLSAYTTWAVTLNTYCWTHIALTRTGSTLEVFINGTSQTAKTVAGAQNSYDNANPVYIGNFGGSSYVYAGYISDYRIVKGSRVYTANFTPPSSPLSAITNTSLLINFRNGAVVDNAAKNAIETVGNAQVSTTQTKFGTGSLYFDGTGDWLKVQDQLYLRFGTGNFTIEFWVYLASGDTGSSRGLVAKGTSTTGWLVSLDTTQKVVFTYTTSTITSTGSITTNAWNHIAVVREGTGTNQTKIYIGGSNDGTGTVSTDFTQASVLYVGADRSAASPMKGYIDDVRITTGVARYTANFTPPTRAFPDK